ncbi:tumor protein p53-inducible nuclear protein 2 [Periophthalmus magnuspinnatus]|uniref:tumor protein p53-inducible nuclear protein 2 n=1 Tax=Periophthalmus magnuspinnatus TaxID=409849 RepID=UPI0024372FB6|nr:tumor protein p53-inducible nuclear protein 2 [Periophthalmus magnuspinnatus]
MFRIITNLLFGKNDKPIEDISSMEMEDEEWHVVNHQEAVTDEHQKGALLDHQPKPPVCGSTVLQDAENSVISSETQDQTKGKITYQAIPGVDLPKVIPHVAQSACVQRAKAWADRHSSARKAVQRQNRLRHRVQQQVLHLHQPGPRNLCH